MACFTPKFFRSITGMVHKQDAHSCLCQPIVHFLVTGLARFHPGIFLFDRFDFFDLFGPSVRVTDEQSKTQKDKGQPGYNESPHTLPSSI
jgi:hypothetical protein